MVCKSSFVTNMHFQGQYTYTCMFKVRTHLKSHSVSHIRASTVRKKSQRFNESSMNLHRRMFSDNKIVAKHSVSKSFCNQNTFSESIYMYTHAQGTDTRSISLCFSYQGQYKNCSFLTDGQTPDGRTLAR